MNLSKLKWRLGFCVKEGCFKKGVNELSLKGFSKGKPIVFKYKVCLEHTDELIEHLKEKDIKESNTNV